MCSRRIYVGRSISPRYPAHGAKECGASVALAHGCRTLRSRHVRSHHHDQSVRLLLLRRLWAYAEVAYSLESHCLADWICASARSVYDQSVSGVSALGFGPLRFRLGPRGLLLFRCRDLRLASVPAKSGDVRSLPLCPPSSVPLSKHRSVRALHHVAAGDHIPIVCGHALCLLLPRPGGRAANANSSSWIRRVHAWHGHVPAG